LGSGLISGEGLGSRAY